MSGALQARNISEWERLSFSKVLWMHPVCLVKFHGSGNELGILEYKFNQSQAEIESKHLKVKLAKFISAD